MRMVVIFLTDSGPTRPAQAGMTVDSGAGMTKVWLAASLITDATTESGPIQAKHAGC